MESCGILFAFEEWLRYLQKKIVHRKVDFCVGVDGFEPPTLCL